MEKMEICNLSESVAYCEALGMSKIWKSYALNCSGEEIMEIGFNEYSGYVYIALENGLSIACAFGREVEYIVFDGNRETFYDSYFEAVESLN